MKILKLNQTVVISYFVDYYVDDLEKNPSKAKEATLKKTYLKIISREGAPIVVKTNWTIVDNVGYILA